MCEKYAIISKENSIILEEMCPEVAFIKEIFKCGFCTKKYVLDNLQDIEQLILEDFNKEDQELIGLLYGLHDKTPKSKEELSFQLNLNLELIEKTESRILRKLRHPSKTQYLLGKTQKKLYKDKYYMANTQIQRLQKRLCEELRHLISGNYKKYIYLSTIMDKNHIKIEIIPSTDPCTSIDEFDLDLSTKVYNFCKRRGIKTLKDLREATESQETSSDNFMINEATKEIESIIQLKLTDIDSEFSTCIIHAETQKIVYKYRPNDEGKIVQAILKELLCFRDNCCNLFKSNFSPGLIDFLLMKGYLYEEDVIDDYNQLCKELANIGFSEYVREILGIKKSYNFPKNTQKLYVVFDEEILQLISSNSIKTLIDLDALTNSDISEQQKESINKISDYLYLRDDKTCSEYLLD